MASTSASRAVTSVVGPISPRWRTRPTNTRSATRLREFQLFRSPPSFPHGVDTVYLTPPAQSGFGRGTAGLEALHARLYGDGCEHPGDAFYVLLCRVSLGRYVRTRDGVTSLHDDPTDPPAEPGSSLGGAPSAVIPSSLSSGQASGSLAGASMSVAAGANAPAVASPSSRASAASPTSPPAQPGEATEAAPHAPRPIFANKSKRELAPIPQPADELGPPTPYHSVVVEVGGKVKRHREFVCMHSDRTYPEYLLCYRRLASAPSATIDPAANS